MLATIVILTKDGEYWLKDSLSKFLEQKIQGDFELLIIDSGSQDKTIDIIRTYDNIVLHQIPASEFNHGSTRNLAVKLAKGTYIAFTVQDAKPVDEYWLQNLLNGFTSHLVAAVNGIQIVENKPENNPYYWYRKLSEDAITNVKFSPQVFNNLSTHQKKKYCSWDNVNAIYRKTALQELPFQSVKFGEDMFWAIDALSKGFEIVYSSYPKLYHYHNNYSNGSLNRHLIEHLVNYKAFEIIPKKKKITSKQILSFFKWVIVVPKELPFLKRIQWLLLCFKELQLFNTSVKAFMSNTSDGKIDDFEMAITQNIPMSVKPNKNNAQ